MLPSTFLKSTIRSLAKDRKFTGINLFGLTLASAAAILLVLYFAYEYSYDSLHDQEGAYQLYTSFEVSTGPQASTSQPIPMAPTLKAEVPGIQKISRYNGVSSVVTTGDKKVVLSVALVDPDFFSIFRFPVIEGDKVPLKNTRHLVLSQSTATTLFGSEPALGRIVSINIDGKEKAFTVQSIVKDAPPNSSIHFDLAIHFSEQSYNSYAKIIDSWDHSNHDVYLKLATAHPTPTLKANMQSMVNKYNSEFIRQMNKEGVPPDPDGEHIQLRLLPLKDMHFAKSLGRLIVADRLFPNMLIGTALLILFIACINFVNMSIARNLNRIREIGMRKTLGAKNTHLFLQFWGESLLIFILSFGLGILLAWLLLPSFQTLFKTKATLNLLFSPYGISILLFGVLIVGFLAGGYPALRISKIETVLAIKGKTSTNGGNSLRDVLIVFQYAIAIALISGTLVLYSQLDYLRSRDLGFDKEQVISFILNGSKKDQVVLERLRNELSNNPDVLSITAAIEGLGLGKDGTRSRSGISFDYEGRTVETNISFVDQDYLKTLGLELREGRSFERNRPGDSLAVLINESMAKQLGKDDLLNSQIWLSSQNHQIIGILKDYHFDNLDKTIEPLTLFLKPDWNFNFAFVRVKNAQSLATLESIGRAYKKIDPEATFLGSYLDENIDRTLKREQNMITMITSGSILAILLSSMGLFAMSLIVAAQRKKEIGIRKVVGASTGSLTLLLTKDFIQLVFAAFLIATPIAWWVSKGWLEQYPYRIELSFWLFLIAGGIALVIAVATISFKTIQAASINPVKNLRTE